MAKIQITPKQQRFLLEYVKDLDAAAAARRAGMERGTANLTLRKPHIQEILRDMLREKARVAKLDAAGVLRHAVDMLRADIADVIDDNGNYKPLSEWPLIWRQMLSSCEIQTIHNAKGEDIGAISRMRFADRVKVLELVGRHIDVRAFAREGSEAPVHNTLNLNIKSMPIEQLRQMREWLIAAGPQRAIEGRVVKER